MNSIVPKTWRCCAAPAAALACACGLVAQSDPANDAELNALLEALQPRAWSWSASVSGAWGHRENPGLNPLVASPAQFGEVGLDGFAQRESEHWKVLFSTNAEARWYDGQSVVDDEARWFGRTELSVSPWSWLEFAATARGVWRDQVLDLTEEVGARVVAEVKMEMANGGGTVRLRLPAGLTVSGTVREDRTRFEGIAQDYDATEATGELRWSHGTWLRLEAEVGQSDRDYLTRREATVGGRLLNGTQLSLARQWWEGRARLRVRRWGNWRLDGRWQELENRDEASGFYDYDRRRWSVDMTWYRGDWELRLGHQNSEATYVRQTVGAGLQPAARLRKDTQWEGEVRRLWGENWESFLRYSTEESWSNEVNATYTDEVVSAGVGYQF